MLYTTEQVMNGVVRYMDNEILSKMPTAGKVVAGTVISMAIKNSSNAINQIQRNPLLKTIGAVNNDGMIDVDSIFECLREAANKYGDIVIAIPFMGDITLKPNDVELLKRYIL